MISHLKCYSFSNVSQLELTRNETNLGLCKCGRLSDAEGVLEFTSVIIFVPMLQRAITNMNVAGWDSYSRLE